MLIVLTSSRDHGMDVVLYNTCFLLLFATSLPSAESYDSKPESESKLRAEDTGTFMVPSPTVSAGTYLQ